MRVRKALNYLDEIELNGRPDVQEAIMPYLNALDGYIKINPLLKQSYKDILQYCN